MGDVWSPGVQFQSCTCWLGSNRRRSAPYFSLGTFDYGIIIKYGNILICTLSSNHIIYLPSYHLIIKIKTTNTVTLNFSADWWVFQNQCQLLFYYQKIILITHMAEDLNSIMTPWKDKIQNLLAQEKSPKYKECLQKKYCMNLSKDRRNQVAHRLQLTLTRICNSPGNMEQTSMEINCFYDGFAAEYMPIANLFFQNYVSVIFNGLVEHINIVTSKIHQTIVSPPENTSHDPHSASQNQQTKTQIQPRCYIINFFQNTVKLLEQIENFYHLIVCKAYKQSKQQIITEKLNKIKGVLLQLFFNAIFQKNQQKQNNTKQQIDFKQLDDFTAKCQIQEGIKQKIIDYLNRGQSSKRISNLRIEQLFKVDGKDNIEKEDGNKVVEVNPKADKRKRQKARRQAEQKCKPKQNIEDKQNLNCIELEHNIKHGIEYIQNIKIVKSERSGCLIEAEWLKKLTNRKLEGLSCKI